MAPSPGMIEKLIPLLIRIVELISRIFEKWLDQDDKLE